MSPATPEQSKGEALTAVSQYLSDQIPPLSVADSVRLLLLEPARLLTEEIMEWAAGQSSKGTGTALLSDYLFHALKKLHEVSELKLIPQEQLQPYWAQLAQGLLQMCPESERNDLEQSLANLGRSKAALSPAISLMHRAQHDHDPQSGEIREQPGYWQAGRAERRFSMLIDRLQHGFPGDTEKAGGGLSPVVSMAAAEAKTAGEIDHLAKLLAGAGAASGTEQVFRHLSQALPGWVVPGSGEGDRGPLLPMQNAVLSAIRQILRLSESRQEGWKRFQEMVHAAVDQFNAGSLARAVTMLEMSRTLIEDGTVDAHAVETVSRTAKESLDVARLRRYAEDPQKHQLLRRALAFFPEYSPLSLLEQLEAEPKRDRRRMLLNLLDAHGLAARDAAFECLSQVEQGSEVASQWYFARNLICILSRIPRRSDVSPDQEITIVSRFLHISYHAPLIREAIGYLSQLKDSRSEKLLVLFLGELEKRLLEHAPQETEATRLQPLLDRVVSALARYSTSSAWRAVVSHGLKTDHELGDTLNRLSSLAGQDLSPDTQVIEQLTNALQLRAPRKVFGVTIKKDAQALLPIVKALSATPALPARTALEQVAKRFPDQECGRTAAKALQAFASDTDKDASSERLLGDLELFGLPDLLQQLARTRLSGTLTLKDPHGEPIGTIELHAGRMSNCSVAQLQGKAALYELLAKPVSGTFVFMGHKAHGTHDYLESADDLIPLVVEGMRQYEELQRARVLVPDGCRLGPAGVDPVTRPEEEDPMLFQKTWSRVSNGATPEECEAEAAPQQRQVRLLLARWVEDSNLIVIQQVPAAGRDLD